MQIWFLYWPPWNLKCDRKQKRITFGKLWRAIDLPLQEPAFCTYISDLIYHPRQMNYYCCQHVFILIWPCIINFTQQTPFIVFKCKCGIEPCVSWDEAVNNAKYILLLPAQSVSLKHGCKLSLNQQSYVSVKERTDWKQGTCLNEKRLNDWRCS